MAQRKWLKTATLEGLKMRIIKEGLENGFEVLHDFGKGGKKEKPWREKKEKSIVVSESFKRLSNKSGRIETYNNELYKQSVSIRECGTYLEFKKYLDSGELKLHSGNFCKKRLCPMCQWRRSLKMFFQVSKIMEKADVEYKGCEYIFLTLTVKNVFGCDLYNAIDKMQVSYKRLLEYKDFKLSVMGGIRVLEVTRNKNKKSDFYGSYHPHFHCILMVPENYFTSVLYRTKNDFAEMWNKSLINRGWFQDVVPICDVRKISASDMNLKKAVCEVSKYSVKDSDILDDDLDFMDEGIEDLYYSLKSRRMVTFSGSFRKIKRSLLLDDVESGDLINIDGDMLDDGERAFKIINYIWNNGIFEFVLMRGI